jgi:hypothetical protein
VVGKAKIQQKNFPNLKPVKDHVDPSAGNEQPSNRKLRRRAEKLMTRRPV